MRGWNISQHLEYSIYCLIKPGYSLCPFSGFWITTLKLLILGTCSGVGHTDTPNQGFFHYLKYFEHPLQGCRGTDWKGCERLIWIQMVLIESRPPKPAKNNTRITQPTHQDSSKMKGFWCGVEKRQERAFSFICEIQVKVEIQYTQIHKHRTSGHRWKNKKSLIHNPMELIIHDKRM